MAKARVLGQVIADLEDNPGECMKYMTKNFAPHPENVATEALGHVLAHVQQVPLLWPFLSHRFHQ
jgi:hypothetical protein